MVESKKMIGKKGHFKVKQNLSLAFSLENLELLTLFLVPPYIRERVRLSVGVWERGVGGLSQA